MSNTSSRAVLKEKLHAKIKQKQAGRMSNTQRQKEVDDYCKKLGVSEAEMKALAELSETFKTNNKKKNNIS